LQTSCLRQVRSAWVAQSEDSPDPRPSRFCQQRWPSGGSFQRCRAHTRSALHLQFSTFVHHRQIMFGSERNDLALRTVEQCVRKDDKSIRLRKLHLAECCRKVGHFLHPPQDGFQAKCSRRSSRSRYRRIWRNWTPRQAALGPRHCRLRTSRTGAKNWSNRSPYRRSRAACRE
jgi:hypothetical protein